MNTTDATLTNGRYELPAHARGVLVLADPPEAGWRLSCRRTKRSHPKLNRCRHVDWTETRSSYPSWGRKPPKLNA